MSQTAAAAVRTNTLMEYWFAKARTPANGSDNHVILDPQWTETDEHVADTKLLEYVFLCMAIGISPESQENGWVQEALADHEKLFNVLKYGRIAYGHMWDADGIVKAREKLAHHGDDEV